MGAATFSISQMVTTANGPFFSSFFSKHVQEQRRLHTEARTSASTQTQLHNFFKSSNLSVFRTEENSVICDIPPLRYVHPQPTFQRQYSEQTPNIDSSGWQPPQSGGRDTVACRKFIFNLCKSKFKSIQFNIFFRAEPFKKKNGNY